MHPKRGTVFTPEVLRATHELTQGAWRIPFSIRVDSITNFQHTKAEGDDLIVADLVSDPRSLDRIQLERVREIALNEPLLRDRLVSSDGHVTAVNVTVQFPRVNEAQEVPKVTSAARDLVRKIREKYPDLDVYLSGIAIMNNAFSEMSKQDMASLVPISLMMMVLVLGVLTWSVFAALSTFLVLTLSIVAAMGAGGWVGCLLYTSPSPRDLSTSRMPSSA